MNAADMAGLLGIDPDEAKNQADKECPRDIPQDEIEFVEDGVERAPRVVVLPTALHLDAWDLDRGVQCLAASKNVQEATGVNMQVLNEARQQAELAMADMHAVAFQMDPRPVDACSDPRRLEFVKQLLETPDCQALRQSTVLNDLASEMAATQFGLQYVELVKADAEREKKQGESRGKVSDEKMAIQRESGLRRAVSKAITEASKEVEDLDNIARGLGGDGSTSNTPQEAKKLAEAYKRIKNSRALQEIFNRAGAFRRYMQSAQRRKVIHGTDDVVGVVMDGDVHRLLPVELAKMGDELLEMDVLRRLVERQAMCREYRGHEKVARGPVVVCVDESGSMGGEPVWNAKAFALAMAVMARQQGRWCALVGYAGGTEGTRLVLPPGKWDQAKVMEWLVHFFSGGTTMDVPLVELPKWWSTDELKGLPQGKTDIVLITDAIVDVPADMEAAFCSWKADKKAKVTSLIIGSEAGDLKKVSDRVFCVKGISLTEDGVTECLSL